MPILALLRLCLDTGRNEPRYDRHGVCRKTPCVRLSWPVPACAVRFFSPLSVVVFRAKVMTGGQNHVVFWSLRPNLSCRLGKVATGGGGGGTPAEQPPQSAEAERAPASNEAVSASAAGANANAPVFSSAEKAMAETFTCGVAIGGGSRRASGSQPTGEAGPAAVAVTGTASGAFAVWENLECVKMVQEAHGACVRTFRRLEGQQLVVILCSFCSLSGRGTSYRNGLVPVELERVVLKEISQAKRSYVITFRSISCALHESHPLGRLRLRRGRRCRTRLGRKPRRQGCIHQHQPGKLFGTRQKFVPGWMVSNGRYGFTKRIQLSCNPHWRHIFPLLWLRTGQFPSTRKLVLCLRPPNTYGDRARSSSPFEVRSSPTGEKRMNE